MQKMISTINNEEGSAIIIAVLVLVLLTILGTSATQTTIIELEIVRNDLVHKDQLYRADGAVIQASQWIEDQPDEVLQDITTDQADAIISKSEFHNMGPFHPLLNLSLYIFLIMLLMLACFNRKGI